MSKNAAGALSHRSTRSPNHPMSPQNVVVCSRFSPILSNPSHGMQSSFVKSSIHCRRISYANMNVLIEIVQWMELDAIAVSNLVENTCLKEFHWCLRPTENMVAAQRFDQVLSHTFQETEILTVD